MKGLFSNITLRNKLLLSFAFIVLVMAAQGVSFIDRLSSVNQKVSTVVDEVQPALLTSRLLSEELNQASTSLGFYLLSKETQHKDAYLGGLVRLDEIIATLELLPAIRAREDSQQILRNISSDLDSFSAYQTQVIELVEVEGKNIQAMNFASQNINPASRVISQLLTQMILDEEQEDATPERKQILADLNNLRYAWSNLMNEMRLFLAFRAPAARENMSLYRGSMENLLTKVQAWGDDLTFEQTDSLEQFVEQFTTFVNHLEALIKLHESDKWRMDAWMIRNQINPILASISSQVEKLVTQLESASRQATEDVDTIYHNGRYTVLISGLLTFCMLCLLGWALIRNVLRQLGTDPNRLEKIADSIANGNLETDPECDGKPSTGVFASIRLMQGNLREMIESERQAAAINNRVRHALDNVSGNAMITDPDNIIIYINGAANRLLHESEAAIRTEISDFHADTLIGTDSDIFHHDNEAYARMIEELSEARTDDLVIGGLSMRFTYNPVVDEKGVRIGTVIEIIDRTQQVAIEEEVQHVVSCAKAGDLSRRISLEGKDSFFAGLSSTVNDLVENSENIIRDTVCVIGAMARGDLSSRIEADYQGTFGELRNNTNTSIDTITGILDQIKASAQMVASASREIAQGNDNLSSRTEEQAASLQETTDNMEVITQTAQQNTSNAQRANLLSMDARKQAENSGIVSGQAISAMTEITTSSREIADIIGVIDEIAFQTNLLALNAAVEAARAGEQGRGFAVVASEVRNLAGRSATAAREIKELIGNSIIKVEEGSNLVGETGNSLNSIIDTVKQVCDIIAEIARASSEQSESIGQIGKAVSQMGVMTQQNAALVEQAAAASESMSEQAQNLNQLVDFFSTGRKSGNRQTPAGEHRPADRSRGRQDGSQQPSRPAAHGSIDKCSSEGDKRRVTGRYSN